MITRKDDDRNEVGECDEGGDLLWFWQYDYWIIGWSWWNTFRTNINDAPADYEDDIDDDDDDEEKKGDDDDDEN